jgi:hypothetical protein
MIVLRKCPLGILGVENDSILENKILDAKI